MDTSLFTYDYPPELTAQHPLSNRADSRMMVLNRKSQTWEHRHFSEILNYLKSGDLLVLNNAEADLVDFEGKKVPPLPPYIKRKKVEEFIEEDYQRYRTVYAKVPGSKAAPTAGFHFTDEILKNIREMGIETAELTLHVNYDTFKPIRSQKLEQHPMHGETFEIPIETQEKVQKAKTEGRRVIAVGTTVVRALESNASLESGWRGSGTRSARIPSWRRNSTEWVEPEPGPAEMKSTSLFIVPGYPFKIVDALLTNFHRPRSTVLVMVSAFGGREFVLSAYQEAVQQKYRLFSYGDCMLII